MSTPRPRIGVSSCLPGRQVHFNGGHKKSDFVAGTLSRFAELVPVCPEAESGMPVPRESLRLVSSQAGLRLELVAFHSAHKLLYMARSPVLYRELGWIAAQPAARPLETTMELYAAKAMAALGEPSTPGKQANVLQHSQPYPKELGAR